MIRSTLRSGVSSASSPVLAVICILPCSLALDTTFEPSTTSPSRTDRSVPLKRAHSARQRRRSLNFEHCDAIAGNALEMYLQDAAPIPGPPLSKTSYRRPQVHLLQILNGSRTHFQERGNG